MYTYKTIKDRKVVNKVAQKHKPFFAPKNVPDKCPNDSTLDILEDYDLDELKTDENQLKALFDGCIEECIDERYIDQYKLIFDQYFYKGMSSREIGQGMGLTRRQVLYRLDKIKGAIIGQLNGADILNDVECQLMDILDANGNDRKPAYKVIDRHMKCMNVSHIKEF